MSNDKKYFILSADLIHTISFMPKEKAGELFMHILSYVNDKDPSTEDVVINIAFEPIKKLLIDDFNRKRQRSQAGINSALSRSKIEQDPTRSNKEQQDSTNVNKTQQEATKPNKTKKEPLLSKIDYQEIVNIFNNVCTDLSAASVTPKRITLIDSLLKIYSLEQIGIVFQKTKESDYLSGKVQKWRANLDWLLNPNNFVKTLEGNYDNIEEQKTVSGSVDSQWREAKTSVSKYFNNGN